jgi:penicillin-binding protein 1A
MAKGTNNKTNNKAKGKRIARKVGKSFLYTFLLIIFIGIIATCAAVTVFFVYIAKHAPTFDENMLYTHEPSNIYANGKKIATIGTEDRVILTYDEIPEVLVNAIVATEDSRFFQHNGIDLPRFIVASLKQIKGGEGGGASTLTMQLSKNTYTSKKATGWEGIVRKFTDVYLAVFKIAKYISNISFFCIISIISK